MTHTNGIEAGYLLNNADAMNKIILDRITHYGADGLAGTTDPVLAHTRSGGSCAQNKELMEQIQNLQSVIDVLMELRR